MQTKMRISFIIIFMLRLFFSKAKFIALLGRPTSWEAEERAQVDYDTCCQEICRAKDSCKSYDQIWQPSRDIYECRFYRKNYQVLKAEGEMLKLVPRVQYYSKMYKVLTCSDWWLQTGANKTGNYKMSDGTIHHCDFELSDCADWLIQVGAKESGNYRMSNGSYKFCNFTFTSCKEVVDQYLLESKESPADFSSQKGEVDVDLDVEGQKVRTRCMNIEGLEWTVFQKRLNPTLYPFHKKLWLPFKDGFRDSNDDFYLGNKWIRAMTNGNPSSMLAIGLLEGAWGGEKYNIFRIGTEDNAYGLVADEKVNPPCVSRFDLRMNDKRNFVTIDRDGERNCSTQAFNGEGYAGWENNGASCTANKRWFPNAEVPQRKLSDGSIQLYEVSILMFRTGGPPTAFNRLNGAL